MPLNLQLSHSIQKQDVLVQYDESKEDSESIRRRTYWLACGQEPMKNRYKSRFVSAREAQGLAPIQVVDTANTILPLGADLYAVVSTNTQACTLYSKENKLGFHELPVYADAPGRVKQVLLTPVAVADLTIIGGVLGLLWLESDAPGADAGYR